MKVILNLDKDILNRAKSLANRLSQPLCLIFNEALRIGLPTLDQPRTSKIYRMPSRNMVLERGGERVEEGKWKLEELNAAEEIFLTNARIGIRPVRSWKGRILATSTIGLA